MLLILRHSDWMPRRVLLNGQTAKQGEQGLWARGWPWIISEEGWPCISTTGVTRQVALHPRDESVNENSTRTKTTKKAFKVKKTISFNNNPNDGDHDLSFHLSHGMARTCRVACWKNSTRTWLFLSMHSRKKDKDGMHRCWRKHGSETEPRWQEANSRNLFLRKRTKSQRSFRIGDPIQSTKKIALGHEGNAARIH